MKYKITIEHFNEPDPPGKPFWKIDDQTVSSDRKVLAATLRALADKFDPPPTPEEAMGQLKSIFGKGNVI